MRRGKACFRIQSAYGFLNVAAHGSTRTLHFLLRMDLSSYHLDNYKVTHSQSFFHNSGPLSNCIQVHFISHWLSESIDL